MLSRSLLQHAASDKDFDKEEPENFTKQQVVVSASVKGNRTFKERSKQLYIS